MVEWKNVLPQQDCEINIITEAVQSHGSINSNSIDLVPESL